MPLFDASCPEHGHQEIFSSSHEKLECLVCGRRVERRYSSPPSFKADFTYGWDMGAGRYFDTKAQRDNWMREAHVRRG
jgi:hypothetical protein